MFESLFRSSGNDVLFLLSQEHPCGEKDSPCKKKLTFTGMKDRFHKSRRKKNPRVFSQKMKNKPNPTTKILSRRNASTSQILMPHFWRDGKLADELLFKDSFSLARTGNVKTHSETDSAFQIFFSVFLFIYF